MREESQASLLLILTPSPTSFMKERSLTVLAWVVGGMEWSSLAQTGNIRVLSLNTWQSVTSLVQMVVSREMTVQVVLVLWSRLDNTSWQLIIKVITSGFFVENTEWSEILERTVRILSNSAMTFSVRFDFHSVTATLKATI